jgi:L-alanine-DL-glutamate epimerase-like enolase superfamily enzyme
MSAAKVSSVSAAVYRFPTPEPEADGTLEWDATTAVIVTLEADGCTGVGWTYSSPAAAAVVANHLADAVLGLAVPDTRRGYEAMRRACRNLGTKGLVMQAISAVDIAWWDLKARLSDASVSALLGRCRDTVAVYGSGGFTTLSDAELEQQVYAWAEAGCRAMKIKIGESWGTRPERDLQRVAQLREFAGPDVQLMVDANGGYSVGTATRVGRALDELGVVWFEEPVSSDDIRGLCTVRTALDCDVTAGEYAADLYDARALIPAVDCLQLDATRCGGYTGWLAAAALAAAHNVEVSAHCAPALHAPVAAAASNVRHIEWFVDHARLEPLLVDGCPAVVDGAIPVPTTGLGHGMSISVGAEQWRMT